MIDATILLIFLLKIGVVAASHGRHFLGLKNV
jgi:hypothetical protein